MKNASAFRSDKNSLLKFLKRPHGECFKSQGCQAPKMMAFPDVTINNIDSIISNRYSLLERGKPVEGEVLFNKKCASCHTYSDLSGYNTVALSLFSAQWIYAYANGKSQNSKKRLMPIVEISAKESANLYSFFQQKRELKEQESDILIKNALHNLKNLNKGVTDSIIDYVWGDFWKDGDCVHCHSIGGRATQAFDTSLTGITRAIALLRRHVSSRSKHLAATF